MAIFDEATIDLNDLGFEDQGLPTEQPVEMAGIGGTDWSQMTGWDFGAFQQQQQAGAAALDAFNQYAAQQAAQGNLVTSPIGDPLTLGLMPGLLKLYGTTPEEQALRYFNLQSRDTTVPITFDPDTYGGGYRLVDGGGQLLAEADTVGELEAIISQAAGLTDAKDTYSIQGVRGNGEIETIYKQPTKDTLGDLLVQMAAIALPAAGGAVLGPALQAAGIGGMATGAAGALVPTALGAAVGTAIGTGAAGVIAGKSFGDIIKNMAIAGASAYAMSSLFKEFSQSAAQKSADIAELSANLSGPAQDLYDGLVAATGLDPATAANVVLGDSLSVLRSAGANASQLAQFGANLGSDFASALPGALTSAGVAPSVVGDILVNAATAGTAAATGAATLGGAGAGAIAGIGGSSVTPDIDAPADGGSDVGGASETPITTVNAARVNEAATILANGGTVDDLIRGGFTEAERNAALDKDNAAAAARRDAEVAGGGSGKDAAAGGGGDATSGIGNVDADIIAAARIDRAINLIANGATLADVLNAGFTLDEFDAALNSYNSNRDKIEVTGETGADSGAAPGAGIGGTGSITVTASPTAPASPTEPPVGGIGSLTPTVPPAPTPTEIVVTSTPTPTPASPTVVPTVAPTPTEIVVTSTPTPTPASPTPTPAIVVTASPTPPSSPSPTGTPTPTLSPTASPTPTTTPTEPPKKDNTLKYIRMGLMLPSFIQGVGDLLGGGDNDIINYGTSTLNYTPLNRSYSGLGGFDPFTYGQAAPGAQTAEYEFFRPYSNPAEAQTNTATTVTQRYTQDDVDAENAKRQADYNIKLADFNRYQDSLAAQVQAGSLTLEAADAMARNYAATTGYSVAPLTTGATTTTASSPVTAPPLKEGGEVDDDMVKHLVQWHKGGGHTGPGQVKGIGSGQEDLIPAWLSDGEYVWSAQDVADLGDGSTDEGVRRLDKMRQMVRRRAGRKDVKKIAKPQQGIDVMLKAVGGSV